MKVVNVEKGKVLPDVMFGKQVFAYEKKTGIFYELHELTVGEVIEMLSKDTAVFFKIDDEGDK